MPDWLRWILVLPAALGAYFGIQVLIGLLSELIDLPWFIPSDWGDVYQDWISQGLNSVMGPIALIYAGVRTSPRGHRFHTSVVLAVLFGVIAGALAALSLFLPQQSSPRWWLLTTTAASIITVIAVCIRIQQTEAGPIDNATFAERDQKRNEWLEAFYRQQGRRPTDEEHIAWIEENEDSEIRSKIASRGWTSDNDPR